MSAREEMLASIRKALGPEVHVPSQPRAYRTSGAVGGDVVELFRERVSDYRATVHRVAHEGQLVETLQGVLAGERVVRAPGALWIEDLVADSPDAPPAELDSVGAALTGCALAIAETGTIVLDGSPICGRRALTLVPDHHVCVVRRDQVVASVPDAIERLAEAARAGSPITFVSGPSATSDIELNRVEGVHGPRKLDVVLLD
jgi:L-lactate dehydrogenase complex protein LldG